MHHNQRRTIIAGLASLLTALACGGGSSEATDLSENASPLTKAAQANVKLAAQSDAGAGEACTVDTDCDPDEVCTAGQCSNNDGESQDDGDAAEACTVDTDCDSDEVCTAGFCSDADGEEQDDGHYHGHGDKTCNSDDGDGQDEADEEGDEQGDDGADDGADDNVVCAVDADCDSDEVCTSNLCTGVDDVCTSDADCDSDEACTNGSCEDR
jgi:hypothetical protein